MMHRLPEVHSTICADAMKSSSRSTFKADAKLAIAISQRHDEKGTLKSVEKVREEAKKNLRDKINERGKKK